MSFINIDQPADAKVLGLIKQLENIIAVYQVALDSNGFRRILEVCAVTGRIENDRIESETLWSWVDGSYQRGLGTLPHPEKFSNAGVALNSWFH